MRLVALRSISERARIFSSVTASSLTLHPSSVGSLSFSAPFGLGVRPFSIHRQRVRARHVGPPPRLTEEVLDQIPVDSPRADVPEGDDGRDNLADAEILHLGGEGVGGVEGAGVDLAGELAVGEHLEGQRGGRPEGPALVEDGLVEDVVVAEVVVRAAGGLSEARVLLLLGILGRGRRVRTYLRLASCSRTLCRFRWSLQVIGR
ncbi:hypothetical protein VUR80DRAFT_3794 [Thermomyces stellatus]